jgi:ATP adenylyltransferase
VEKRLWAPWRLEYIEAPKPESCIFCDFPAAGPANDRQNLIVHRAARCFTMLNRFPYNSGHVMVIPRAHVSALEDLGAEDFADLQQELLRTVAVLKAVYRPDGMNVGMNLGAVAGAGIADHIHYHVVPRWTGDTNFMPVLAEAKVLVEHLETTWDRIQRGFAARAGG